MYFKTIKNYCGLYKISDNGKIYSWKSNRYMSTRICTNKYETLILYKNGKGKSYSVHRLVADAFIPNPDNLPLVDHINRNKLDNRVENLKWVSHRDNIINSDRVENRQGSVNKIDYKNKNGTTRTRYVVTCFKPGEYGPKSTYTKSFKTEIEAEAFRVEKMGA